MAALPTKHISDLNMDYSDKAPSSCCISHAFEPPLRPLDLRKPITDTTKISNANCTQLNETLMNLTSRIREAAALPICITILSD